MATKLLQLVRLARFRVKGGRRRRVPKQQYPLSAERSYLSAILGLLERYRRLFDRLVAPELESLFRQAQAENVAPRGDSYRADAVGRRVAILYEGLRRNFDLQTSREELDRLASRAGLQTSAHNKAQLEKQLKAAVGVDVIGAEPRLAERLEAFALENVALIKSIPDVLTTQLEQRTLAYLQQGKRAEDLAKEIDKRFQVGKSRAALIARDQIGKLNGQLTRTRQQALGLRRYRWRTSRDERVRESHADMEGELCEWDDPPVVDGEAVHPGEPIQCRCTADPAVEEVLEQLEEEDET